MSQVMKLRAKMITAQMKVHKYCTTAIWKCHVPELSTQRNHLSLGLLHKVLMESTSYSYTILPNAPLSPTTYFTRSHGTNMYVLPFVCTKVHSLTLQSHYWNNLPSLVATYPQTPLGWAGLQALLLSFLDRVYVPSLVQLG